MHVFMKSWTIEFQNMLAFLTFNIDIEFLPNSQLLQRRLTIGYQQGTFHWPFKAIVNALLNRGQTLSNKYDETRGGVQGS